MECGLVANLEWLEAKDCGPPEREQERITIKGMGSANSDTQRKGGNIYDT